MKWRSKIWAGIGIVLVVLLALFMVGESKRAARKGENNFECSD